MRVVIKKVGQLPEVKEIDNTLDAFQEIVGGNIETFRFAENILCVCNEEGKLIGLKPNFICRGDAICGDVFFCADGLDDFDGLTDEDAEFVIELIKIMYMTELVFM